MRDLIACFLFTDHIPPSLSDLSAAFASGRSFRLHSTSMMTDSKSTPYVFAGLPHLSGTQAYLSDLYARLLC
jgi:hypothetical protein